MAGIVTETILGGAAGQDVGGTGGSAKDMAKGLARQTTGLAANGIVSDLILGSVDVSGTSLIKVVTEVAGLAWKAGAYLHHRGTIQTQLAACLEEYCEAGYLARTTTPGDDKATVWQTTSVFRDAKMVLDIYTDIKEYLNDQAFTEAEMRALGIYSDVSLYADSKKLNDIGQRLSACCARAGVKDITKTDAEKRIENVSFVHMGAIALQNAFIAEGERRERGDKPAVVPVLGRVLSVAAICGLSEITVSEITTILGKAPIFETVARARIAKVRNQHASQIFNGLLFGGSTESAAKLFGQLAASFAGERVLVGHVKAVGKSEFLEEYASSRCELSGPSEKNHEVGKPIYMIAGWANLIKHREPIEKQHGAFTQMVHLHAPTKACDIHGNTYMSAGKMGKIVFSVKELADGSLMAKPKKFERFDYKSKANYKKGSSRVDAMGEEKLFGGIVGPATCTCQGGLTEINTKGQLIKNWKLGKGLKICSRDSVGNSISHTNEMSTKKISILWRPGDWAMGCFFMQTLPQSSYLQGRGQCLYCAVEGAALAGCPEVISCGGGKVSIDAVEHEKQKGVMKDQRPMSMSANVVPVSPTSTLSSPVTGVLTPPPPYGSPQGSARPPRVDYFTFSDATGDKIVPANPIMSIGDQIVPATEIISIPDKIARDRIVPLNDVMSVGDGVVPRGELVSVGDKTLFTNETTSIGGQVVPSNEVISTDDNIIPTNETMLIGAQPILTNDVTSIDEGTVPKNETLSRGEKTVPANENMSIGKKTAPTNEVKSVEDKIVVTNEVISIDDQVPTNNFMSIGDQISTSGLISFGDQLIPSIDITSIAAKIGTSITRKAVGSALKATGSATKPVEETAKALCDFQVQAEGHLTFKKGDVIRIVKKPQDENEWWTGELNGKHGIFPGNHVSPDSVKSPTATGITRKAVATSKKLESTAAATSKKLESTAAATSKKLGSTARWLKKGYADISRTAGRNDLLDLENTELGASEDSTLEAL